MESELLVGFPGWNVFGRRRRRLNLISDANVFWIVITRQVAKGNPIRLRKLGDINVTRWCPARPGPSSTPWEIPNVWIRWKGILFFFLSEPYDICLFFWLFGFGWIFFYFLIKNLWREEEEEEKNGGQPVVFGMLLDNGSLDKDRNRREREEEGGMMSAGTYHLRRRRRATRSITALHTLGISVKLNPKYFLIVLCKGGKWRKEGESPIW